VWRWGVCGCGGVGGGAGGGHTQHGSMRLAALNLQSGLQVWVLAYKATFKSSSRPTPTIVSPDNGSELLTYTVHEMATSNHIHRETGCSTHIPHDQW